MTRPIMLAADHIRELTQTFTTAEHVRQPTQGPDGRWRTQDRIHHVTHQALLDQIADTVTGSTTAGEMFHAAYGSKPAGRIDCLAYLERLDRQSRAFAAEHGLPLLPLRDRLSRLSGVLGDRPNHTVKAWWATARVLSQHDGPPLAPDVPCPQEPCERWGTIRARLDERIAVCVECHHVWSDEDGTFGRLAIWAQWAAEHLRGPRHWRCEDEVTGYPGLGYRVECVECAPERLAMAKREAARLADVRRRRALERVPA